MLIAMSMWERDIEATGYTSRDRVSATRALLTFSRDEKLNSATLHLVTTLRDGRRHTVNSLADSLVGAFGVPRVVALADVCSFVRQGQTVGAVNFHSTVTRDVLYRSLIPFLRWCKEPFQHPFARLGGRRSTYDASPGRVALLAARGQGVLSVLMCLPVVALFALLWPHAAAIGGGSQLWLMMISFVSTLTVSMSVSGMMHELAHLFTGRLMGVEFRDVYTDGLKVGLRRDVADPLKDLLVSLSGPLSGVCFSGAAGWLLVSRMPVGHPAYMVRVGLAALLVTMIYHLACLVPPAADGTALRLAFNRAWASSASQGAVG